VTVTFAMILVGLLLVYGGWKGKKITALLRGDNS
jgi:hypothetical protein